MDAQQTRIDVAPKTVRCCPQRSAGVPAGDVESSAPHPHNDQATVAEAIRQVRPAAETGRRPASTKQGPA